nr:tetratricopeptide repeat protein [Pseudodesulfovibrio sp. JC047]
MPLVNQSRLVASGYGVWVAWKGELHNAVSNTLQEYGALCVVRRDDQALWFCDTDEIFRAIARLQVWARVNPTPVFCQVIPLTLLVGYDLEYTVSLPIGLDQQSVTISDEFELIIHSKLKDKVKNVQGLGTEKTGGDEGLASVEWLRLTLDQGLDYESLRKWYFVIKPLGKMSDKESILGWRDFSAEIVELLQRLGLKYISDVKEGALFFPLESFRLLRSLCTELLGLIKTVKDDESKRYWPIVMAAVLQGSYQFTADLPQKIGLDWNRMTPDFPYVRFMDGFLLSEWFRMNEARYGTEQVSLDSWCTLSLKEGGDEIGYGTMQVALPEAFVAVEGTECFYCGLKNHRPDQCPSKEIVALEPFIWRQLSKTNIQDFSQGFEDVDAEINVDGFASGMSRLLASRSELKNVLSHAVFEINAPGQLRTLKSIWRSRGKDWVDGFKDLAPEEGDFIWDAFRSLERGEMEKAELFIKEAQSASPRNYQPHSLWGFWYLEKGDFSQALFHWQEAERLSYTPLQQGCMAYFQGRLLEVQGNLKDAINLYKHANSLAPTWLDPSYRQAVCMVKMGFTGQAMDLFFDLIDRDPHVFNRILVDPELDRGRVQLMNALWEQWMLAEESVNALKDRVVELADDIEKRFHQDHDFSGIANTELNRLKGLGQIQNFVAYQLFLRGTDKFESDLHVEVKNEIKRINCNLEYLAERVRHIQKEAAWFPFPRLLLEFNREFNACVDKINWVSTQRLSEAENFRRSLQFVEEIEEHISSLQRRLVTLRIIRDSTLFVLMLGRNFIWLELIGLGLLLVGIPTFLYFTRDVQGSFFVDMVNDESKRWEICKGIIIILSTLCVAFSTIKTAMTFEKKKRQLFDKMDDEYRQRSRKRY